MVITGTLDSLTTRKALEPMKRFFKLPLSSPLVPIMIMVALRSSATSFIFSYTEPLATITSVLILLFLAESAASLSSCCWIFFLISSCCSPVKNLESIPPSSITFSKVIPALYSLAILYDCSSAMRDCSEKSTGTKILLLDWVINFEYFWVLIHKLSYLYLTNILLSSFNFKTIRMNNIIPETELILNPNGSVYHLQLLPEHIAPNIIIVGDPGRVETVSRFFDTIDFKIQNREFVTHGGTFKGKRVMVLSSGIGTDNIDILINKLDAAV